MRIFAVEQKAVRVVHAAVRQHLPVTHIVRDSIDICACQTASVAAQLRVCALFRLGISSLVSKSVSRSARGGKCIFLFILLLIFLSVEILSFFRIICPKPFFIPYISDIVYIDDKKIQSLIVQCAEK